MADYFQHYDMFKKSGDGKVRLNIGCGNFPLDGYINLDLKNPKANIQMDFFDFVKEGHTNEFDEVLASHVLEHISQPNSL